MRAVKVEAIPMLDFGAKKKKKMASVDNIGGILAVNKWGREWGMRRGRKGDSFIATADCSWSQNKARSGHCRLAL